MHSSLSRVSHKILAFAAMGTLLVGAIGLTQFATASPADPVSSAPPWEPDASSVGGLTFYDAAGQVITGGNTTDSPLAAYVEGTGIVRAGDTKATLFGYLPVSGQTPGQWSGEALGASTTYPNTAAPAPLNAATLPVETGAAGDETVAQLALDFPNDDTSSDGYCGMYVLRLKTSAVGKAANTTYDSADIQITGSTWAVVYPIPTTTVLTASPSSPQQSGTSVTLTATVTAGASGTVQFENGSTPIGSPVTVSAGTAATSTSTLPVGTNTLNAVFTPTAGNGYSGSTGSSSFTVTAIATTTVLTASPTSPQLEGTAVTLTATITAGASGSVQFENGSTPIGSPVTVSAGTASTSTSTLPVGADTLHAVFTPTAGNGYSGSTGSTTFTVTAPIATTTVLAASPTSPQQSGTSVTLTATVTAGASGTVQFENGSTPVGSPVTVTSGSAATSTSTLPVGTDTLNAVFTPTPGNGYGGSTGSTSFTVTGIPTTTVLTASPSSPQQAGTSVTMTATVTAAPGTVQFENGSTPIGSPVTVSAGTADNSTNTLPVGTNKLNAFFTPTAGNGYSGSTGSSSFTVTAISTTTVLTASPTSPQLEGTAVTLTATITAAYGAGLCSSRTARRRSARRSRSAPAPRPPRPAPCRSAPTRSMPSSRPRRATATAARRAAPPSR